VELEKFLQSKKPQPEKQRHIGLGTVIDEPLNSLQIGFLQDIRRVDPALKSPVEAETNHQFKPFAVLGKKLAQRCKVAGACLAGPDRRAARIFRSRSSHNSSNCATG